MTLRKILSRLARSMAYSRPSPPSRRDLNKEGKLTSVEIGISYRVVTSSAIMEPGILAISSRIFTTSSLVRVEKWT
jgi:hypothetical protein